MPSPDLASVLSQVNYRHPDLTKRQVQTLLHHYKGLAPKKDKFIFNDGQERDLINIQGTVPVPYRGQNYNIPVSLYLLDTHPYHAPLCFVKPTSDMQVKVSKHVDAAGKIYLPYLHEWAHPASDLIGLVQICIVTFSEQPPVYAKPKQQLPYPPPPQQGGGFPPYPAQGGGGAYPQQGGGYPPAYPPQATGYPPAYPATGAYPPQAGGTPGYPPPYPPAQGGAGYPPYPTPGYPPAARPDSMTGTVTAEHLTASIRSAVEDKVRRGLREQMEEKSAEIAVLRRQAEELGQGQTRLQGMVAKIQKQEEEVDRGVAILEQKKVELEKIQERAEAQDPLDPDEAVDAGCPLYRQLIAAYAEEGATSDAIYFLGKALGDNVVGCEAYLKQVRVISRKQFMLRETMDKCRKKAGLDRD